jgi:hypothetical protein
MREESIAIKDRRRIGVGLRRVGVGVRVGAVACAAVATLAVALPVAAHHSFSAEFDASRAIKITGDVTKLEWANPHAWIHVNASEICERPGRRGPASQDSQGTGDGDKAEPKEQPWNCKTLSADEATEWGFELASPNGLMRQGWSRKSLQQGDHVTIEGWRARDDSAHGSARVVTTADGKRLFAGASQRTSE